jgi:two-component system, OmpR family, phosphate regulon response regulator PhoB
LLTSKKADSVPCLPRAVLSLSVFRPRVTPKSSPSCHPGVSNPPQGHCLLAAKRVPNNCILVADDESDVVNLISQNLRTAGFEVSNAADGTTALSMAMAEHPALVILDVMMPGLTGFEVCKLLKRDPSTEKISVLLLTAKSEEIDRILGFELGADDYLTKPFSPRELILRVQNILRRKIGATSTNAVMKVGRIVLDVECHQVLVSGRSVDLTVIEFKLLRSLMEKVGRVQTRDYLLMQIWGYDRPVESRTVDTHMRRLREKLGVASDQIRTVRGFGYRIGN